MRNAITRSMSRRASSAAVKLPVRRRPLTLIPATVLAVFFAAMLAMPAISQQDQGSNVKPTLEPVAETKLIMQGIAQANFRGLERLLKTEPPDVQTWTFARGQALLIAESGNLMMLRPPKGQGQSLWFQHSMKIRTEATELARATASKDYANSRKWLVQVANTCNSCHRNFQVQTEIVPFGKES
jgi:hypothetical protein